MYDGKGNIVNISDADNVILGADIIAIGDSNVYYSYGNSKADIGSIYERLWTEFGINSLTQLASPGINIWQAKGKLIDFATENNIEKYNKNNTIFIFHVGTNDELSSICTEYNGNENTATSSNGIGFIAQCLRYKFPKAHWFWVVPQDADWTVWSKSDQLTDYYAARVMEDKVPHIIKNLEKWRFPYIDAFHQSGITTDMLTDGVHLGGGSYNYSTDAVYKYYRFLRAKLISL